MEQSRMKKTLLSLASVLAIATMIVAPAFAATNWDLNIHNDTEESVKVTLTGPKNYSFTLEPGKWAKTVAEGEYKYAYGSCGQKFSGTITVKDDVTWLIISPCSAIPEYAKFVVDSHLGQQLTLTLTGPQTYALSIALGTNRFLSIQTGYYTYSYDACGSTLTSEVRVTKNGTTDLILYACEQLANHPLTPITSSPSNLRIASHYSFPIRITLLGPANYSFQLVTGLNRFNVQPGDYSYFFTAYGQNKSGFFSVNEAGATIIVSPLKP
jgi:hypothetical protein